MIWFDLITEHCRLVIQLPTVQLGHGSFSCWAAAKTLSFVVAFICKHPVPEDSAPVPPMQWKYSKKQMVCVTFPTWWTAKAKKILLEQVNHFCCLKSMHAAGLLHQLWSNEEIQNLLSGSTWTWAKHVEGVVIQPSTPWLVYSLLFVRCCWGDVALKGPRTLPEFWTRSPNVTPLIIEEACSHGGPLTLLLATQTLEITSHLFNNHRLNRKYCNSQKNYYINDLTLKQLYSLQNRPY